MPLSAQQPAISRLAHSPVARFTPMVSNGKNHYRASQHFVEHRVRKPLQYTKSIAIFIGRPAQWRAANVLNHIKHFSAKSICGKCVPLSISKKGIGYVSLRSRSKNNNKLAHRALRRARASAHGTAWATPERRSLLRWRISSAQALTTEASSSPSRLSSSATTTAERSLGSSASASSIRWSTRAFMGVSLAVSPCNQASNPTGTSTGTSQIVKQRFSGFSFLP